MPRDGHLQLPQARAGSRLPAPRPLRISGLFCNVAGEDADAVLQGTRRDDGQVVYLCSACGRQVAVVW